MRQIGILFLLVLVLGVAGCKKKTDSVKIPMDGGTLDTRTQQICDGLQAAAPQVANAADRALIQRLADSYCKAKQEGRLYYNACTKHAAYVNRVGAAGDDSQDPLTWGPGLLVEPWSTTPGQPGYQNYCYALAVAAHESLHMLQDAALNPNQA